MFFFPFHCYCHPTIYSLLFSSLYSVNSFIANVIFYITIPCLNKVFVSCILYLASNFVYGIYDNDNDNNNENDNDHEIILFGHKEKQ